MANNTYYKLTDFISRVSLAHPSVKTFSLGPIDSVDMAKQTLFPLAHLEVNNAVISAGKVEYDITYYVLDRVGDITPESAGNSNELVKDYVGVTNIVDVHNTSLETINDVYSYLLKNPDDALDYNIVGAATLTPIEDRFDNMLAGFAADFTISLGNENGMCSISL